ncbi:hypothetical protein ACRRTK_009568 [Alexandromys fortis]
MPGLGYPVWLEYCLDTTELTELKSTLVKTLRVTEFEQEPEFDVTQVQMLCVVCSPVGSSHLKVDKDYLEELLEPQSHWCHLRSSTSRRSRAVDYAKDVGHGADVYGTLPVFRVKEEGTRMFCRDARFADSCSPDTVIFSWDARLADSSSPDTVIFSWDAHLADSCSSAATAMKT